MKTRYDKFIILILTTLLVVVLVIFVFWYKNYNQKNIELIGYVPAEAVSYVEFNLTDKIFNNYLSNNQKAKGLLEEFILKNDLPANIWRGDIEIDNLALIVFKNTIDKNDENHENYLEKAWLVHGREDVRQLEATELVDYYYATLNQQTAVLSKSRQAVQLIKNSKMAINLDKIKLKDRDREREVIFGYIKSDLWGERLKSMIDLDWLSSRSVLLESGGTIYWWAGVNAQKEIFFDLEVPLKDMAYNNRKSQLDNFLLLDGVIEIQDILLDDVLPILEEMGKTEKIDKTTLENYFSSKYQADIKELYTFFEQPILLVLKPKKKLDNLENLFNFSNYFYALATQHRAELEARSFLLNLESFVRSYLAFKFPETRVKILPDKTTGLELVADTDKFIWQLQKDSNTLRFVEYKGGEVAYGWNDKRFVLANSRKLVEDILASQAAEERDYYFNIKLDAAIVNNKYFDLIDELWLESEVKNGRLLIKGKATSH